MRAHALLTRVLCNAGDGGGCSSVWCARMRVCARAHGTFIVRTVHRLRARRPKERSKGSGASSAPCVVGSWGAAGDGWGWEPSSLAEPFSWHGVHAHSPPTTNNIKLC